MIINLAFKSKLREQKSIILKQEKKKLVDYGHNENEWGSKDDSEKIEWEEYYENKNRKCGIEDDEKDEELLRSKSEPMESIDASVED